MKLIEGSLCPLAPLRFLCDEMLINVAQWLRIAGYDTSLPDPGSPDRQLVDRSRAEQRWLVTADADLLEFACGMGVCPLSSAVLGRQSRAAYAQQTEKNERMAE